MPEALLAPFAPCGQADDHVGRDDQAVPLPPACVPLALARDRHADERLREEQEARDDARRAACSSGAGRGASSARRRPRTPPCPRSRSLRGDLRWRPRRPVPGAGHACHRPREPHAHGAEDGDTQQRSMPDQRRCEARTEVDEGRAGGEDRTDHQPDRDRDLETGTVAGEEDVGGAQGVEPEEAPGRHEREGEQEHAGVAAPICRLARRVAEHERERAREPEDDEVEPVVLEVRVEARPEEQRDETDERQRRDDGARQHRRAEPPSPGAGRVLSDVRGFHRPVPWRIVRVPTRSVAASRLGGSVRGSARTGFLRRPSPRSRARIGLHCPSGRGSSAGRAHG